MEKLVMVRNFAILSMIIGMFVGCSAQEKGISVTQSKSNLSLRLVSWDDDVKGVLFEVEHNGNIVASEYKELEDEYLPQYLDQRSGPKHYFADMYFVLAPGEYTARAIPMISEQQQSKLCLPAETKTDIYEHKTTEIVLVMNCDLEDNGGLDIIAQTNRDPKILDLIFDPSKFIFTCEDLKVDVDAKDPEGDILSYNWSVVSEPPNSEYEAAGNGSSFDFMSKTAGEYGAKVEVCDTFGMCTELTFPIHVTLGKDDNNNGIGDDCEQICILQEAPLIGITPEAPFQQTGTVKIALLPKDDCGQGVCDTLSVNMTVSDPQGTAAATSVTCQQPGQAQCVATMLLFDGSGSMSWNDPNRLRVDAGKIYVDKLGPNDWVAVGEFQGSSNGLIYTKIHQALTQDLNAAKGTIDLLKQNGGTPMYESLNESLNWFAQQAASKGCVMNLLLLGDGQPNSSTLHNQVCANANSLNIRMDTVGLGPAAVTSPTPDPNAVQTLQNIAYCSGGTYISVATAADLATAFDMIGDATVLGSMIITATFNPIPAFGATVSGTITVDDGNNFVNTPYSFTAP